MRKFFVGWAKKRDGSIAVEFSLLATPFIFMIVGIIETALMFTTQSMLEYSTSKAARMIRTGEIQQSGGDQEQIFRQTVCGFATQALISSCDDIQFEVQDLPDFSSAADYPDAEFDEDGNMTNQGFSPGGVSDVVLIRVGYSYDVMTPVMQYLLQNQANGRRNMLSTIVLQTEPYDFE